MNRSIKSTILLLAAESAALLFFVFLVWFVQPLWFASAVVGGLIFFIPNTYFTVYALPFSDNRQSRWFLGGFYRGLTGKLILTAIGFALAFSLVRPLHAPALFMAFCLMTLVHLQVIFWRLGGEHRPGKSSEQTD